MYFDSFGGNVFVANAIVSMLKRYKEDNNVIINAYVDSASASSSSFLMMVADNIYLYENSVVLIHKPMLGANGANADDLRDMIKSLDTMEDNIIIPLYMKHAKEGVTEQTIKDVMKKGDWLSAQETSEIFDVVILSESKQMVAQVEHNKDLINCLKPLPVDKESVVNIENVVDEELELANAKLRLALL
ncbi:ATP-dependent Clp protease proteolytic subunit [Clostridium gasigenes]|nr:ATP-dependent Clp protease proteolytic subunit [Clostridium gasigenes]